MSFLVLALTFALLAAPLWSAALFRGVYDLERRQVAVDNSAIVIGRGDRRVFTELSRLNNAIRNLEIEHHVLHACARTPSPAAAQCAVGDRAAETMLENLHRVGGDLAKFQWRATEVAARAEAAGLNIFNVQINRPRELPVAGRRCPICSLEVYWELSNTALPIRTGLTHPDGRKVSASVELSGRSLLDGKRWEYRLKPE